MLNRSASPATIGPVTLPNGDALVNPPVFPATLQAQETHTLTTRFVANNTGSIDLRIQAEPLAFTTPSSFPPPGGDDDGDFSVGSGLRRAAEPWKFRRELPAVAHSQLFENLPEVRADRVHAQG